METIKIIVGGHEYEAGTSDAFGPRYLSDLIQEVLVWQLKLDGLRWLSPDETGKHPGTNYDVHDSDGKRISPYETSMRDIQLRPSLRRVFVNKPIGFNG